MWSKSMIKAFLPLKPALDVRFAVKFALAKILHSKTNILYGITTAMAATPASYTVPKKQYYLKRLKLICN